MMTEIHLEALSRFFDGEHVAPDLLTESLSQPGASDVLVEFARLSQVVTADASLPDDEFCEAMRRQLRPSALRRFLAGRLVPAAVAASLALTAFAVGYSLRPLLDQPSPPLVPPVVQGESPVSTPSRDAALTRAEPPPSVAAPQADCGELTGPVAPTPGDRVSITDWHETRSPQH